MRRRLSTIFLLAVLAATAAACGSNRAGDPRWVDHNNDGYEDGGM